MSVDIYRIRNGYEALELYAGRGGWGSAASFLKTVDCYDALAHAYHAWWIVQAHHLETFNEVPKSKIEAEDSVSLCVCSPPGDDGRRQVVAIQVPAFRLGGHWYITESTFDDAMTACFEPSYTRYLALQKRIDAHKGIKK